MLIASKWLLTIAGVLLIYDATLIATGQPNPVSSSWPLPCPVTLILLGLGLILFAISSKTFKK